MVSEARKKQKIRKVVKPVLDRLTDEVCDVVYEVSDTIAEFVPPKHKAELENFVEEDLVPFLKLQSVFLLNKIQSKLTKKKLRGSRDGNLSR